MFEALFRKEWRQLRMLRRGGFAVALLLPFLLLIARLRSSSPADLSGLVAEGIPFGLALAIWPLLSLMFAVQVFAGEGDFFLLERPVSRRAIWGARLLAVGASTFVVAVVHILVWLALVWWIRPPELDSFGSYRHLPLLAGAFAGIAILAGAAAAPLVRTTMSGLLLGIPLAAAPVAALQLLLDHFRGYAYQGTSCGWFPPVFLLLGFALASYHMECRGEPAGRGKIRRGVLMLVLGALAAPLALMASAPIVQRLGARGAVRNTHAVASSSLPRAMINTNRFTGAAWLVDAESGDRMRFFPSAVLGTDWSDDGASVAVAHTAGRFGRTLSRLRIEIVDGTTGRTTTSIDVEPGPWLGMPTWAGPDLLFGAPVRGEAGLHRIDGLTGAREQLSVPEPFLLRDAAHTDQGLEVLTTDYREAVAISSTYRLDRAAGTLVATSPAMECARPRASPSWRFLACDARGGVFRLLDKVSGDTVLERPRPYSVAWLERDRLAFVAVEGGVSTLSIWEDGKTRPLATFSYRAWLEASPDRTRALVFGSGDHPRSLLERDETVAPLEGRPSGWAGPDRVLLRPAVNDLSVRRPTDNGPGVRVF